MMFSGLDRFFHSLGFLLCALSALPLAFVQARWGYRVVCMVLATVFIPVWVDEDVMAKFLGLFMDSNVPATAVSRAYWDDSSALRACLIPALQVLLVCVLAAGLSRSKRTVALAVAALVLFFTAYGVVYPRHLGDRVKRSMGS